MIRTVYANEDGIAITYSDPYTHCKPNDSTLIRCYATLTDQNYKEHAPKLTISFPRGGRIALKCSACDLQTFPNDILTAGFRWEGLDFTSSNIRYLKMNDLHATLENTMHRLCFYNNSISRLDDESFLIHYQRFGRVV